MAANRDPQRRPVFFDRANDRLLADPAISNAWQVIELVPGMFGNAPANTVLGRYGSSGAPGYLGADVTIDLINTATSSVIAAARVAAGTTTQAGVVQLEDATNSTSTTTAATPNSVKSAYDLAGSANALAAAALPKAGGTMTGAITFSGSQPLATTSVAGIVTLTDSTTSTSTTTAATPNSVKTAKDAADAALPKAGGTMTGAIAFASGQAYPQVPQNAKTAAYTLVAGDAGKHVSITTGGVTIPQNVFSVGDAISIYNNSGSDQTITQGTGVTLRLAGTSFSGNRTIALYGLCTILCVASNNFVINGAGLS